MIDMVADRVVGTVVYSMADTMAHKPDKVVDTVADRVEGLAPDRVKDILVGKVMDTVACMIKIKLPIQMLTHR